VSVIVKDTVVEDTPLHLIVVCPLVASNVGHIYCCPPTALTIFFTHSLLLKTPSIVKSPVTLPVVITAFAIVVDAEFELKY
jgi:hypothetical protein